LFRNRTASQKKDEQKETEGEMKYTFDGRVRFSEVDENRNLTLYSLLNYLQDCATFHGEDMGIGIDYNQARDCAWVIADLQLKIHRTLRMNDRIHVHTWADKFRGVIGHRCFSVEDTDGQTIALANSNWVFMDMKRQIPVRVPADQMDAYGCHPEWKISEDLGKRKIRMPEGGEERTPFFILESHLDANMHMNNAQYVRLAGKYLPGGLTAGGLRTEWVRQARLGDRITPRITEHEGKWYVEFLSDDGESYFLSEFTPM
jgi:acyl-ACP thioesterase